MITTLIAAVALGLQGQTPPPLSCPATGEEVKTASATFTYGGATYGTCCGGCDEEFSKSPAKYLTAAIKKNITVGAFNYDPVSGEKIDGKKAAAYSDYKAIRYFFASTDEKKSFDAKPTQFVTDVKKEAYFCPVMKHATDSKKAGGFADVDGTRYYLCCADCLATFKKEPSKYLTNASKSAKALSVTKVK